MRVALASVVVLTLACPAQAGVYNLAELHPFVPLGDARGYILRVRSAAEPTPGTPLPESFRAQVLRQAAYLEQVRTDGPFSTLDRVNLSACYLRLGRAGDALKLLLEERSDHFLILANLASAYFLTGEMEMAVRTQERLLTAWPGAWADWTEERRIFFRDCERHLLRVFEMRREESRKRQTSELPVDAVFPGLRFVGPGGTYQAGALSPAMRDKIPSDGFAVVFQLCSWYPGDSRLYWLLGESLNVLGHIDQAADILDELVRNGRSGLFSDLPAHRRVLRDALPAYRELRDPVRRGQLLCQMLVIPRPSFAGAAGEAAYAAGSCAGIGAMAHFAKVVIPGGEGAAPDRGVGPDLPFNWRHVTVGFAFGFLVSALIGFQVQEWRRRKTTA